MLRSNKSQKFKNYPSDQIINDPNNLIVGRNVFSPTGTLIENTPFIVQAMLSRSAGNLINNDNLGSRANKNNKKEPIYINKPVASSQNSISLETNSDISSPLRQDEDPEIFEFDENLENDYISSQINFAEEQDNKYVNLCSINDETMNKKKQLKKTSHKETYDATKFFKTPPIAIEPKDVLTMGSNDAYDSDEFDFNEIFE